MLHTILLALQIVSAFIFIVLMAVQTDRAEQSGVMGLGGQGGRMSGSVDMPVGAERILKPLTKWTVVAFLFLSALAAAENVTYWHVLAGVALYALIMIFGARIWDGFIHMFGR